MVARADNRSLLGTLNDFSFMLQWQLTDRAEVDLVRVTLDHSHTPVRPLDSLGFPDRVRELFRS